MSVNSISSSNLWQILESAATSQVNSATSATTSAAPAATSAPGSADSSSLSGPGQFFSELQKLATSNPTEFKKITAEVAQQLQSAAQSSTDPGQANFLNQMASNFEKASQSGNFSDLFPQGSSNGSSQTAGSLSAPPPHYSASSSTSSSSSSSTTSSSSNSQSDPLQSIFAQALAQITTDLSSTTSAS